MIDARALRLLSVGSKAEAVRRALVSPHMSGWPKKLVRDWAVRNWKARRGNLQNPLRPSIQHLRDRNWAGWLAVTAKRREKLLQRATR